MFIARRPGVSNSQQSREAGAFAIASGLDSKRVLAGLQFDIEAMKPAPEVILLELAESKRVMRRDLQNSLARI